MPIGKGTNTKSNHISFAEEKEPIEPPSFNISKD